MFPGLIGQRRIPACLRQDCTCIRRDQITQGNMMKTSVIEVHDMLSAFSVDEVEKRIGEVPGVGSVTVNYAAGSATVRFDETRLAVADIKSSVRQQGYASVALSGEAHEGNAATEVSSVTAAPVPPSAAPVDSATPDSDSSAASKQDEVAPLTPPDSPVKSSAVPAGDGQEDNMAPENG